MLSAKLGTGVFLLLAHSFIAYIDESGDDGLDNFRQPKRRGGEGRGGASTWLVISARLLRFSFDLRAVGWRDEIIGSMPERKSHDLHFANLNHAQKVLVCQCLVQKPIRAISILSNKMTIPAGVYKNKNQLYFYLTRYLIERVSWICRDYRRLVREGDGRVQIIFSRRGGMSYPDFRDYLMRLQTDAAVQIHWPVIDIEGIRALDHSARAGLQLADSIASAFAAGVEPNRYGNCEARYAEILKPRVYCRNKNYLSYGVKLVPRLEEMELSAEQDRFLSLFR